jgi:hypothetical protein
MVGHGCKFGVTIWNESNQILSLCPKTRDNWQLKVNPMAWQFPKFIYLSLPDALKWAWSN